MKYFADILIEELKLIFTDRYYLFVVCLWPFIDCLFLGGIYFYGNVKKMPVAVFDCDNTKLSRTITRYFNTSYAFDINYRVESMDEMKNLMLQNKIYMGICIPKDTQKNIKKLMPSTLQLFIDGSNYLTANLSEIESSNIIATVNAGLKNTMMKKRGINSKTAKDLMLPVKNDTSKMFNPSYHYGYFLTPGLWLSVMGQLLLMFGALTIGRDLENKNFKIKNIFFYVSAKISVYTVISVIYFEILFRIFFPLFGIPFSGSRSESVILGVLFITGTLALGMFMAAVTGKKIDALKGCLLVGSPAFLLSGYTWPAEQMPVLLQLISKCIPLSAYLEGFRKIFQQNMSFEYILPFIKVLAVLLAVYCVLTYICLFVRNIFSLKPKVRQ